MGLVMSTVREQLRRLWRLQMLERKLAQAQQEMGSFPLRLESLQGLLRGLEEEKEREKKRIEQLERDRIKMEGELEMERERLKRSQLKLLEVKTNKEYQALLKEIEIGQEHNSQREEEVIRLLDEIDRLKAGYAALLDRAQKERDEIEKEQARIRETAATVQMQISDWEKERDELMHMLDAELLRRYTMLKDKRNGIAVVLVKDEGCQGCYVNIPPQLYNEVKKNQEVIACPNCQRILYWEDGGEATG